MAWHGAHQEHQFQQTSCLCGICRLQWGAMAPADSLKEGMVLRPTLEDVTRMSWEEYITANEPRILKAGGACRIALPPGMTPRKSGYGDLGDMKITRAIRQHAHGQRGMYRMFLVSQYQRPAGFCNLWLPCSFLGGAVLTGLGAAGIAAAPTPCAGACCASCTEGLGLASTCRWSRSP